MKVKGAWGNDSRCRGGNHTATGMVRVSFARSCVDLGSGLVRRTEAIKIHEFGIGTLTASSLSQSAVVCLAFGERLGDFRLW